MIVHIVAGGPAEFIPDLTQYQFDERVFWIGVDRGARYLVEKGIQPDMAIGDFDSITENELLLLKNSIQELEKFPPEKDATDMELAFQFALEKKPNKIRVFGATGGRIDHLLGNLFLLSRIDQCNKIKIEMIDKQNKIECQKPGEYKVEKLSDKPYISFIPLSEKVKNLTLIGFKYPLKGCHISFGSTLCISNELIGDFGTYSFSEGILLIVRSSDKNIL